MRPDTCSTSRLAANWSAKERILHVAQSLYHDIAPAQQLRLATVWVNRRRGQASAGATRPAQATPDLEAPDLQTLARLMGLA